MKEKSTQKQLIKNFPEDIQGVPRRLFLKQLLGGAAALSALPAISFSRHNSSLDSLREKACHLSGNATGDEAFWKIVKGHFLIPEDLIMLNAANLCPSPYTVQQRVFNLTRDIDTDPSSNNRVKFGVLREKTRHALAEYLGADSEEIAITRNTSEGNNIVIAGLTFQPGDEVVIWDENHPTANVAWDVRAKRYGFTVKRVKVPAVFNSSEAFVKPFRKALTKRTRVISFSHVSNLSGIALPVKEICRLARAQGILTHIDGAQTFGAHVLNMHDIGCDFYTASSHKWFAGPKEVGVLYIRKERIPEVWPSIVGLGYEKALNEGAKKFETLGQRDDARIAAMETAVTFHNSIGRDRIEQRIRFLSQSFKDMLRGKIPDVQFYTPRESEFSSGVVVFNIPGADLTKALNTLYHEHHIGCAIFGGNLPGIRMCPHIYNTMKHIDKAVDVVAQLK